MENSLLDVETTNARTGTAHRMSQSSQMSQPGKENAPDLHNRAHFIEMERVAGIEPAYTAWKAADQPMIQTRLGTPRLR